MKTNFLVLALIVISMVTACDGQKTRLSEDFSSEYARLAVSLPCKAVEIRKESYKYAAGERFGIDWACEAGSLRYLIMYGDHNPDTPETTETFLRYSKGDLELAFKDQIRSSEEVSIDGRKGYKYLKSNGTVLFALTANKRGILHINMIRQDGKDLTDADLDSFVKILESVKFSE